MSDLLTDALGIRESIKDGHSASDLPGDQRLRPPQSKVLIGPNGSGKTNILQAITLLKTSVSPPAVFRARETATLQCRIAANFLVGNSSIVLRSTLAYAFDEDSKETVIGAQDEWRMDELGDRKVLLKDWHKVPTELLYHRALIRSGHLLVEP
jgi:hypothetical protein